MEKALNELVEEFSRSSDSKEPPNFDDFPVLKRLLEVTFESDGTRRHKSWFAFAGVIFLILALVWVLIFEPDGHGRHGGCLWRTPDWVRDLLRTPVNCSVCAQLTSVDRLEGIVDREEFMTMYVDVGKPVVVTDATKDWLARKSFSFEFFRSIYSNKSRANCQFFRYKSKFLSLQHVFETASVEEGEDPWYVGWSNCDGEIADILRAHYDRPYFLPDLSESAHTDWIFMGSPAYGAHLHVDDVEYPSWQAQIHGRKKWSLYPPPECHYTCPRRFLDVILEPGDTIVVDTNWWYHQTLVIGDELSISIGSEFD